MNGEADRAAQLVVRHWGVARLDVLASALHLRVKVCVSRNKAINCIATIVIIPQPVFGVAV